MGTLAPAASDVKKEQRPRAPGKRSGGFAQASGLKAGGNSSRVESLQGGAVAHHLDLLDRDIPAGEVRHAQFVNQMNPAIRAHERHRGILHRKQQRRHFFRTLGVSNRTWATRPARNNKNGAQKEIPAIFILLVPRFRADGGCLHCISETKRH